jgi:hypothetical protein
MQNEFMKKDAAITVRLPRELKRKLTARAKKERRSLSAQVEHELAAALSGGGPPAPMPPTGRPPGVLLGRFAATKVATDDDIAEVRALLWGKLGRRNG